ncbi:MAG TPA: hypothetical protein DIW47_07030 [Bacteroidetes bacterium]|nr:hypothetical protein [Bacteroidota bacterium]
MKKILIPALFFCVAAFGAPVFAQQAPITTGSLVSMNNTGVDDCLQLFDQLSVKQEGKSGSFRLIGTRTIESNQLSDTHRIWYSHNFSSNIIPLLTSWEYLNSEYGFTGTLYDSVVKFVPDPQNPGQVKPKLHWGYSFNNDQLPISYHYKFDNYFARSLFTYDGAKRLVDDVDETDSGGIWLPSFRDHHSYNGNTELIVGFAWNKNSANWDTLYKKYVWYNANSMVDSIHRKNLVSGVWRNFEAFAYDYDSNGYISREARYNYNGFIKDIELLDMVFMTHDSGGRILSELGYNGPVMVLVGRNIYHYSGSLLDSIESDAWDAGTSTWSPMGITNFTYNAGIITKKEYFVNDNGTFRPHNKLEFTSDANQNISTSAYFIWTPHTGNYSTGVKHYYTYEPYGATNISLLNTGKKDLLLYPNPSKGMIHLEIPFEGSGSYKVFSTDGREVFADNFGSGADRLLVLDLKLKSGIYMIVLAHDSGLSYSGKVAIE